MGEKRSKKDKNKAEKQKQERLEKKKNDRRPSCSPRNPPSAGNSLPASFPGTTHHPLYRSVTYLFSHPLVEKQYRVLPVNPNVRGHCHQPCTGLVFHLTPPIRSAILQNRAAKKLMEVCQCLH
jgi:hypothetical protein